MCLYADCVVFVCVSVNVCVVIVCVCVGVCMFVNVCACMLVVLCLYVSLAMFVWWLCVFAWVDDVCECVRLYIDCVVFVCVSGNVYVVIVCVCMGVCMFANERMIVW